MAFIRQYAVGGDPFQRLISKRKQAAGGPRLKAARKANVRQRRMLRFAGDPFGGMVGPVASGARPSANMFAGMGAALQKFFAGGGAGKIAKAAGQLINIGTPASKLSSQGLASLLPTGGLPGMGGGGGGGGRRHTNPANVKALTRGLRRVESFGRLVKRVNRMLPTAHRFAVNPVLKHKRRRSKVA